jgi:cytochrome c peroxidase
VKGFEITAAEKEDVLAFLASLTDQTFLTNPRHQDPWPR